MSKADAIEQLRRALHMANLPAPKDPAASHERDESGKIVAASMGFRVGYMEGAIREALAELGATDI